VPPSLTLNDIADGAIRLIDEDGPARVTARNLGSELHVAAATLYTVVRSLDEVDLAARAKLMDRWSGVLADVARQGSIAPFVTTIGHDERNAVLYMTDPTRQPSGSLDFVSQLFPSATDDAERADKQAIVHSIVAARECRTGLLDTALAAYEAARSALDEVALPAPAPAPSFLETVEEVLKARVDGDRNQTLARVGLDLVDRGGVGEWDRLTHLRGLSGILGDAAWRRAQRTSDDPAARLGIAAREMQQGANPGLLAELLRPTGDDESGIGLVEASSVGSALLAQALPVLTAVYVSRYARAAEDPDAWVAAPQLVAAMASSWQG